jgi:GxxExxY protein
MEENPISNQIIGAAIKVHKELGPGLLESAYENCLAHVLIEQQLLIEKQKPLPLVYQGIKLEAGFRVDLLVNQKVIVEVKAVDAIIDIHVAQVLTYLKLSGCRLGLIINFNTIFLKNGI